MMIVCRCGNSATAKVLVEAFGPPPAETIGLWSGACPKCSPRSGCYVWGWTLSDGRQLGCDAARVLH